MKFPIHNYLLAPVINNEVGDNLLVTEEVL